MEFRSKRFVKTGVGFGRVGGRNGGGDRPGRFEVGGRLDRGESLGAMEVAEGPRQLAGGGKFLAAGQLSLAVRVEPGGLGGVLIGPRDTRSGGPVLDGVGPCPGVARLGFGSR